MRAVDLMKLRVTMTRVRVNVILILYYATYRHFFQRITD